MKYKEIMIKLKNIFKKAHHDKWLNEYEKNIIKLNKQESKYTR